MKGSVKKRQVSRSPQVSTPSQVLPYAVIHLDPDTVSQASHNDFRQGKLDLRSLLQTSNEACLSLNNILIAWRLAMNGVTWPGMTRVSEPFSALIKTSPGENRDPFTTGKAVVALDAIAKGCGLRLTPFARGNHRPSLPGLITTQRYMYFSRLIDR